MSGAVGSDVYTYGNLKEIYDEDIQYQEHVQNSFYTFLREAGEGEVEFDGQHFNKGVQFVLPESYAAINDGEHLPEADISKGVFAQFLPKLTYATIEATTFAATRGHKGGRPNGKYMDDLIKGQFLSFLSNRDFDTYGNGRGYRATIRTATPGAASFTATTCTWIRPGMRFDWYDSTLAAKRGSIRVAQRGVDRINRLVYVDTTFGTGVVPAGAVAGDILVVYGALSMGEPTDGRYPAGMLRLTDPTLTLGGLSSATWAAWTPTNYNAAGANPTQEGLQLHWDWMYSISGMYPNRLAFGQSWKRSYLSQFLNQRRFTSNSFDTGATNLTFSPLKMGTDEKGKKPVAFEMLEDKNFPFTGYFLFNSEAVCTAHDYSSEPHLADEDDREFRFRLGYDSQQGFIRFWWNTVVGQRNAIGMGYNFAEPTGTL